MVKIVVPGSVSEAVDVVRNSSGTAKFLGGGTALTLLLKMNLIQVSTLVSLRELPDLEGWDRVILSNGEVRVGAGTALTDIASNRLVRIHAPSLARACQSVGNTRIRNVATIGGLVAEADYASDPPAVLVSLGASVVVTNGERTRRMLVADFITDFFTTSMDPEEIVTSVVIPIRSQARSAYWRFTSRSSEDRPCVGVAVSSEFDQGRLSDLRVVVGAVAGRPQWFPETTQQYRGYRIGPDVAARIACAYADSVDPIGDIRGSAWYRREVTRAQVERALTAIAKEPA